MSKKLLLGLLMIGLLFLMLNDPSLCIAQSSTFQGWQVENNNGFYSESNGALRLWTNGGSDCPSIALYKQIKHITDFTFSVQVNAETAESCGIFFRSSLPMAGNTLGFNFEFGHYGEGLFLFARNTTDSMANQYGYGDLNSWTATQVACGDPNVWYTMQVTVSASPFRISTSVFDENGTSIGSFSTSDITNFTFGDINYIGLCVWGYSPSDYSFRNIQDPFVNPVSISISTEYSSTTPGSAVNVFGTLMDSNSVPLQNKTVILSYTFSGAGSWIPISSGRTDEQGNYNIQWINSASGTFTLKAEWSVDSAYMGASNTTTLSFLPYQNQQVFFIESNSTIYDLAFNNETSTLSFNVTGPSETTGYVKGTISKTLLSNGENLRVHMDGKALNYSVTSTVDSWVVALNYSHSTHQISIHMENNISSKPTLGNEVVLIVIIALFGSILAIETKYWLNRKEKVSKNTI
jgi:hypothetical protein